MGESSLQMTKVVLPSDANHMNNTFGGNIMSWMDDAATVCAIKHIRHPSMRPDCGVATIAVDSMAFLGPSMTGDRVTFYAQINRGGAQRVNKNEPRHCVVKLWLTEQPSLTRRFSCRSLRYDSGSGHQSGGTGHWRAAQTHQFRLLDSDGGGREG